MKSTVKQVLAWEFLRQPLNTYTISRHSVLDNWLSIKKSPNISISSSTVAALNVQI